MPLLFLPLMDEQEKQPSKVKKFIKETIRVLRITKKPGREEYLSIVKVTGLGIAIIGVLGFVIFLFKQLFF
jgi:protein transport protein SEC61 subunit gamma and related proteins